MNDQIKRIIGTVDEWFDEWNGLVEDGNSGKHELLDTLEFIVLDLGRELIKLGDMQAYNVTVYIRKKLRTDFDPFMRDRLEGVDTLSDLCTYLEREEPESIVDAVLREFISIWESRSSYSQAGKRMAENLTDERWEVYKQEKPGRRITVSKQEHFTKLAKNWKEKGLPENLK